VVFAVPPKPLGRRRVATLRAPPLAVFAAPPKPLRAKAPSALRLTGEGRVADGLCLDSAGSADLQSMAEGGVPNKEGRGSDQMEGGSCFIPILILID